MKIIARQFIDYIIPESNSDLKAMIEVATLFGFSQIWIGVNKLTYEDELKEIMKESSVELISRLDIDGQSTTRNQIIPILRKKRRNFPIIAIKCYDSELTGWAAQDNRIDIINFPLNQVGKLFTNSVAKLMIKFEKRLEMSLTDLYLAPEKVRIRLIRQMKQAMQLANRKRVSLIINSGSSYTNHLRTPWDLISLSQTICNSNTSYIDSISTIPKKLVSLNKVKVSSDYLGPGVFKISEISKNLFEEEE